jgi:hypothetical protein
MESSKTPDKKRAQHLLRLREGTVARRERIVVEDLTVADAAKLVVTDFLPACERGSGLATAGFTRRGNAPFERPASLAFRDFRRTALRNLERDGAPRSMAMAMVGQKTQEVYRRYTIVDEAMIREAAVKMDRGAKVRQTTAQRTAQPDQPTADR